MVSTQEENGSDVQGEVAAANIPGKKWLFWGCFIALVTTAFGFITRNMLMDTWAQEFGLTATQKGEIFGVGLWPFAVSIVLFSLVVDKVGYGKSMVFAFVAHIVYAVTVICAPMVLAPEGASPDKIEAGQQTGYWLLYFGNLIFALGNGTVEAVINPVVASVFPKKKTEWLNVLHAGWPGGLVIAGIITIAMDPGGVIAGMVDAPISWEWQVGIIILPAIVYGLMLLTSTFPVSERVAAGVSYREMLQEFGWVSMLLVGGLIFREVGLRLGFGWGVQLALTLVVTIGFAIYVRGAAGRPLFIILVLIMAPLATTELGVDSWITSLVKPVMKNAGWHAGWVLVYTSFIMLVLRFWAAGPLVEKLTPLGLLAVSSVLAAIGLVLLSQVQVAVMILIAATVYGLGKTFFWPTMLGLVAEQTPKGGALTLNAIAGFGMLSVGIVGAVFLGAVQDNAITSALEEQQPELYEQIVVEKKGVFGNYDAVEQDRIENLNEENKKTYDKLSSNAKQRALSVVAFCPVIMFLCYIGLIFYFRSKGGYEAIALEDDEDAGDQESEVSEGTDEQSDAGRNEPDPDPDREPPEKPL